MKAKPITLKSLTCYPNTFTSATTGRTITAWVCLGNGKCPHCKAATRR